MKLFYFEKFKYGGIEKIFINLSELLQEDIYLIILDYKDIENIIENIPKNVKIIYPLNDKIEFFYKLTQNTNINILKKIYKLFKLFYQLIFLKKFVSKIKNPININFYDSLLTLLVVSLIKGKKVSWFHNSPDYIFKKNQILKKFFYNKMEILVCICYEQKEDLKKYINYSKKIEVIYNVLNIKEIQEKSKEIIEQEENFIIKIGRLDLSQKDYLTVIKAYEKLYKKNIIKVKLIILGDGPDRNIIENEIKKRNLEMKIILKGNVKNPYAWLKKSQLQIHSSFYEGLPTVLLEGMICKKIIIASKCKTGVSEILNNGKSGLLYEVGDYKKLSLLIEKVLLSQNLQEKILKEIDNSIKNFYPEKILEKLKEVLK